MIVTTYQSPAGARVNLCDACEERHTAARDWPRDRTGQEYCTVSHGAHEGQCDDAGHYLEAKRAAAQVAVEAQAKLLELCENPDAPYPGGWDADAVYEAACELHRADLAFRSALKQYVRHAPAAPQTAPQTAEEAVEEATP